MRNKLHTLSNAKGIQRAIGVAPAARYMRHCGWTLEAALWWLLGLELRD